MPATKSSAKSAQAQERRREQNRIAQRNHRNKVREQQLAERSSASPASDMFLEMAKEATHWPSAPGSTRSSVSYPSGQYPLPVNMYGMETSLNVDFPSSSCSCDSYLGPCEFHRQQFAAEPFTQPQLDQMFSSKPQDFAVETFNWPTTTSGPDFDQNMMVVNTLQVEPVPQIQRTDSMACSPPHIASGIVTSDVTQYPTPPPVSQTEREISQGSPHNNASTCDTSRRNDGRMTQRFTKLLNYMQDCGFSNFDEAVALYYTHNFDKQSAPDAAQRTSRGRRLRKVLAEIEECSSEWSSWEVRGYQDKIVEAAETIYGAEMSNMTAMNEPSPLGWLNQSCNPQQDLSVFQNTYQNKVPNLWNTLSTLVGSQGASGELAATAALSILHWASSNSGASFEDILSAMAGKTSFLTTKLDDTDSGYGSGSSAATSRCTSRVNSSDSMGCTFA